MTPKHDYNWIDDPFKEKPRQEKPRIPMGSKVLIGCGCLLAAVALVIAAILLFSGLSSAFAG